MVDRCKVVPAQQGDQEDVRRRARARQELQHERQAARRRARAEQAFVGPAQPNEQVGAIEFNRATTWPAAHDVAPTRSRQALAKTPPSRPVRTSTTPSRRPRRCSKLPTSARARSSSSPTAPTRQHEDARPGGGCRGEANSGSARSVSPTSRTSRGTLKALAAAGNGEYAQAQAAEPRAALRPAGPADLERVPAPVQVSRRPRRCPSRSREVKGVGADERRAIGLRPLPATGRRSALPALDRSLSGSSGSR